MAEGMVISKAPSRLRPKAMKSAEMKPLTHGLDPRVTMPNGPRIAVVARPRPENSTMIPRQKTRACTMLSRRPPDCRLRKYDIVIGIMGKTQGVKMEARPKPKATARNASSPSAGGGCGRTIGTAPAPAARSIRRG